jgi:hypothetical protein
MLLINEHSFLRTNTGTKKNQEIPNIVWNPKFHYRVHEKSPLVPSLGKKNSAHITPACILEVH